MSRKRSRYRPRPVNVLAHMQAIADAHVPPLDYRAGWAAKLAQCVDAVRRGTATQDDWAEVFDACNLLQELVAMRIAQDVDGCVQAAMDACAAIVNRQVDTGVRAARASELQALYDMQRNWCDLMDNVSLAERDRAIKRFRARHQHIARGGAVPPGVRVIRAPEGVAA